MLTEARKTYRHGFVLTEQELRRLVDTAIQQVQKAIQPNAPTVRLEVKYRNGTVTECSTIEELLSLENIGPKQVVRLRLLVDDGAEDEHVDPKVAILVRFTNLREEDDEIRSVSYVIKGEVRDWVLVTASELEDRIAKIKCTAVHQIFETRRRSMISAFFPLIFALSLFGFIHASSSRPQATLVKDALDSGVQLDPIKAVTLLEQDYLKSREAFSQSHFLLWVVAFPMLAMALVFVISFVANYLYPSYVFCWADYVKLYERRLSHRSYVYVGILLALAIGIVANIIVIKMGIAK
jgi:hypothetical protein